MTRESALMLAGDVGGTNTRLSLFSSEADLHHPVVKQTFSSGKFSDLESLISTFLQQTGMRPLQACLGVAGPVLGGEARLTHLPWVLSEERLKKNLGFNRVYLINDVLAAAWAVPHLKSDDLFVINAGSPDALGIRAIVAPGTGLGEAFLARTGEYYRAYPSEGGHTDFAPAGPEERMLLGYLAQDEPVDYELVCSGPGIYNIYQFVRDVLRLEEPAWLGERLAGLKDPVPVIVETALDETASCALCIKTVRHFINILAAKAANTSLEVLATGGLYLGGGIVPRILKLLDRESFMKTFCRKRYMSDVLSRVPVYAIVHPGASLLGAAAFCRSRSKKVGDRQAF